MISWNAKQMVLGCAASASIGLAACPAGAFEISKTFSGGKRSVAAYEAKVHAYDRVGAVGSNAQLASYQIHAEGKAQVWAFNIAKEIAYGLADGKVVQAGRKQNGVLQAELRVLGKTYFKESVQFEREKEWVRNTVKEATIAKERFSIGGVPVEVSLGASAAAELRALSEIAMANADARPSGYEEVPYLRFALRPKVDIGATARAQAGLGSLASVGVKGSLTFYETGLSAEADYFPSANALLSRVVKEETGIHGKVDAFVRLLGKRVNKTVAKFGDDVPRRQVLWENTRAANSRQPIAGKVPARPCNGEFGAGCNGSSLAPRPRPRPAPIPVRRCPACQLQ